MICRPPRIRPVPAGADLTLYEQRLMQSAHPRSALAKRAVRRPRPSAPFARAMAWFRAEEPDDAAPRHVDDETTQPYTVD